MKSLFSALIILMCFSLQVFAHDVDEPMLATAAVEEYPDWNCSVPACENVVNTEIVDSTMVTGGITRIHSGAYLSARPSNGEINHTDALVMNAPEEVGWQA